MADPHWTSYVGMITGISGAIMGYTSYRKSNSLKSLDLRLELRKAVNELYHAHKQATDKITYANKSRKAVAAATGNMHSGRLKIWEQTVEEDTNKLNQLNEEFPNQNESFSELGVEDLESKLVEIHAKQVIICSLLEKYKAEVASDDETRRHIRDMHGS